MKIASEWSEEGGAVSSSRRTSTRDLEGSRVDLAGANVAEAGARVQELRLEIHRRWGVPSATLATGATDRAVLSTGCALVDGLLPGGGVPRGRLTEVSGSLSSGKTSLVASLVAQVLRGNERVAWVDPKHAFYAPSAARAGISLEHLWLVRPPRVHTSSLLSGRTRATQDASGAEDGQQVPPRSQGPFEFFRAGEHLVQSKAFALVVLDAVGVPGRGIASPLFRISRLALRCHTAVVLITDHPDRVSSLGSCVALRLRIERRSYCFDPEPRPPFDLSGYRVEVQVGKTKLGPAGAPQMVEVRSPDGVSI